MLTNLFKGEFYLNDNTYYACTAIHYENPWSCMSRKTIDNHLFRSGLEIRWGGKIMKPTPLFQKVMDLHWIRFAKDAMNEIQLRGVVPVMKIEIEPGLFIPVVPRGPHKISVRYNLETDLKEYKFYRTVSKKTRAPIVPKWDKKVNVLSHFGYEPDEYGTLRSPISTLLSDDIFTSVMKLFLIRGEKRKSDPRIFLETEQSQDPLSRDGGLNSFYGDSDAINVRNSERLLMDKQEIEAVFRQNQIYNQKISEIVDSDKDMGDQIKPLPPNIPLPVGSKLAKQVVPQTRNDWIELNLQQQQLLCSAYGVDRSILVESGRAYSGIKTNIDSLNRTVVEWSKILTSVLTHMYRCIYLDDDCRFILGKTKNDNNKSYTLTEKDLFGIATDNEVIVSFPTIPFETQEALLTKFILGVIPWQSFIDYSRKISSLPHTMEGDDINKDGDGPSKENIAQALKNNILKGTPFGIVKPKTEGGENGGVKPKKKKKKKAKSEEKKRKEPEKEEKKEPKEKSEEKEKKKDKKKKKESTD